MTSSPEGFKARSAVRECNLHQYFKNVVRKTMMFRTRNQFVAINHFYCPLARVLKQVGTYCQQYPATRNLGNYISLIIVSAYLSRY